MTATSLLMRTIALVFQVYVAGKIGAAGIGLFQLVMSVYTLATTVAVSGVRLAATRLIAQQTGRGDDAAIRRATGCAMGYAAFFGMAALLLLYYLAPAAAAWVGDDRIILSLRVLAFALPFVAASGAMGGYFIAMHQSVKMSLVQLSEQLIRIGDAMPSFGLVLEGAVSVCSTDINGNRMIMASVGRGETFGESLSFLQVRESPIYAQADSDCRILWLSTSRLHAMQEQQEPEGCAFTGRFIAMLAERTLSMNNRIQVLSKKSLREKLMTFFTQRVQESGSFAFEISMDRSAMADYLGVDRRRVRVEWVSAAEGAKFTQTMNEYLSLIHM